MLEELEKAQKELEAEAKDLYIQVGEVKYPVKLVNLKRAWRLLKDQVDAVQRDEVEAVPQDPDPGRSRAIRK